MGMINALIVFVLALAVLIGILWERKERKRTILSRLEQKLMADFSKLTAVNASGAVLIAQTSADADAVIALKGKEDPAIQVAIDAATAGAQANVDAVTTLDAKLKAAAI